MQPIWRRIAPSLVALSAALSSSLCHADPAVAPVEAFGTLPLQTDATLTPDGNGLAWVDHSEPKPRVIMFDLKSRKTQRILAVPEKTKLRQLVWNSNHTLLIILSETRESKHADSTSTEYFRVIAQDMEGGQGRMLPMNGCGGPARYNEKPPLANVVAIRLRNEPDSILMSIPTSLDNCLVEVNTQTGEARGIKVGNQFTTQWVVDPDGRPVAREDWDWHRHSYRVFALTADGVKELFHADDSSASNFIGLTTDGTALVLLTTNGHAHQGAWAFPLGGSPPKLLVEDPEADVISEYTDEHHTVLGVVLSGMKTRIHWFDTTAQHRYEMLQRAFPDKEIEVRGSTDDGLKTLAKAENRSSPPVYYLVDLNSHQANIAAEEYPALANVRLGEARSITYKARDGAQIPAYLTLPAGTGGAALALVVVPHGGPSSRDTPEFDWLAQFLAARGYAVLQPQFRGSTGFGEDFLRAGYRQWAGLMQDDVTDGVKALVDQGIVDPHHVCIVGASYGGYAALAGAAFTPTLYKCAVSINGLSDLAALMRSEVPMYNDTISTSQSEWKLKIGDLSDYSGMKRRSPINAIQSITAPILIVYGTGDGVVPNEQSEKMARALKAAGKPVDVVKLSGEDHWMSRSDTRTEILRQLESFLKNHI
jgi:dipeptidyl aminopeptidase/acylaminoacyl peptidase